jgi:uncharacterized protein (DUF433 family)
MAEEKLEQQLFFFNFVLNTTDMKNWKNHIEANPGIMYGKPVVKGTRIPVDLILEKMSNGQLKEDIIKDYPDLKEEDLLACLAYATSLVRNEVTISLAS